MAKSSIPLLVWFEAIRHLLWQPTITAAELADKLNIQRLATVRSLSKKIRTALMAENASELLAGLDERYAKIPSDNLN